MSNQKMVNFCRLAFRIEGENWNAYFAPIDTLDGAIYLGSIKMSLVGNPDRREQFMVLMHDCFGDICQEALGVRPDFPDAVPAPEHERSGKA